MQYLIFLKFYLVKEVNKINYKKIRRFDTDVHVVEFNPDDGFPSQISFGQKGKYEPLSKIKHSWYERNGYYELAKINLGFFGQGIEHYGVVLFDSGFTQGNPESAEKQVECYLDKDNFFHVGKMTNVELTQIKQKGFRWGASLSYSLVIDGKKNTISSNLYPHFSQRHPRTFIGQRKDKTMILCVADGRNPRWDAGLTGNMEADIMLELGAYNALNADGGGSSEIIIRNNKGMKIVNSPSDGRERNIGTALIVFGKEPIDITKVKEKDISPSKKETPDMRIDIDSSKQNQNNPTNSTIDYLVLENILQNTDGLVNKLDQPISYGETLELLKRVVLKFKEE